MSPATLQAPALHPRCTSLLLAAWGLALLPLLGQLPLFLGAACILVGLWRWQALQRGWPLPARRLRLLLTLAAMAAVQLTFGTVLGRDAGTALLTLMLALKLLETRRPRDGALVLALTYFLTATLALYDQSLPVLLYQLLVFLVVTAALVQLQYGPRPASTAQVLRQAGGLILQALPVMLILFVLFPRLPGPLWGTPAAGDGGLDDRMSPGSISRLGQSDAVAFRVRFDGPVPDSSLLYWRGPVLWYTDGRNWLAQAESDAPGSRPPTLQLDGEAVRYQVTLEPHGRRWLYALDLPTLLPPGSHRHADLLLLASRPVNQVLRYTTASHLHYRTGALTPERRRLALQLPAGANPRTLELGRRLRAQSADNWGVVQAALRFFRDQPFYYTLEPPLLDQPHPLDQFLFQTRRGFCEHYAAAFTVLMRAAGIPSRIVTGYQGGTRNPVGGYLVVRQRDAHAWSEVWLPQEGWVRVDPTAAVAPQRIERGIDTALEQELAHPFRQPHGGSVWDRLHHGLDVLHDGWNQWVLGYGHDLQQQLLARWGLGDWSKRAWLLAGALLLALAVVVALLVLAQRRRRDPAARLYGRFCRKLARCGLARRPSEGPRDFADRISRSRPEWAAQAQAICRLYTELRYAPTGTGEPSGKRRLNELRQRIRRFRP